MLQIREIRLSGPKVPDASVQFGSGPNIIAGESDTGKSYLLRCLDYIFGADELKKSFPLAEPYEELKVEFQNTAGQYLTLTRSLSGGDLTAHHTQIDAITGAGATVAHRRHGTSKADDVTSVLFPFAGIKEASLRKNNDGKLQRLSIRTFLPTIIIDEVSVIDEQSPVVGRSGYDDTARKRMFAYMLTGKDDSSVVATERTEIATARLNAQVSLIDELLIPLEQKFPATQTAPTEDSIEKLDIAISRASEDLVKIETERAKLLEKRDAANDQMIKGETQLLAIDQLLTRYQLLSEHYSSDLNRLDFLAEGTHYFSSLQTISCPLCGENMNRDHAHELADTSSDIYVATRAEAAKILAQRADLEDAIGSLEQRRKARVNEVTTATDKFQDAELRLDTIVKPAVLNGTAQLRRLHTRRVELESARTANEQIENLRALKAKIAETKGTTGRKKNQWESVPSTSLLAFCKEVEAILKEWKWEGEGRVEFDEKAFDIKVDGQSRQSHGAGFRAVLYSAFVIALVRHCQKNDLPHPGFVVIDKPLTSYKRKGAKKIAPAVDAVSSGVEAAFWDSLTKIPNDIQVIIIENKVPPSAVAAAINYEWFAGNEAGDGDRVGFFPVTPTE